MLTVSERGTPSITCLSHNHRYARTSTATITNQHRAPSTEDATRSESKHTHNINPYISLTEAIYHSQVPFPQQMCKCGLIGYPLCDRTPESFLQQVVGSILIISRNFHSVLAKVEYFVGWREFSQAAKKLLGFLFTLGPICFGLIFYCQSDITITWTTSSFIKHIS